MRFETIVLTIIGAFCLATTLCRSAPNLLIDVYRQELLEEAQAMFGPVAELNALYQTNLERLRERHQQSGDLDGVLAVSKEIEAIGTDEGVDPGSDQALRKLQETYVTAREKRMSEYEEGYLELLNRYLENLEKMQTELTREGKVEDAVAVRDESAFVKETVLKGDLIPVEKWAEERRRISQIPADAVEFEGHKYKVIDENVSWREARAKCEELGGYLVSIGSKDEDRFVAGLRQGRFFLWLGGISDESGKNWSWIDGSDFSYTNWRDNRPDNTGGVNYLVMNRWDQWDDGPNDSGNIPGFVCEWE